ncbi:hypothetical protein ABTH97_20130, partial [Acinetobacter baumannii]
KDIFAIPRWVPVNYPRPDELANLLKFLAGQATEEGDSLLLHTKLAHGASYLRALASREAIVAGGSDQSLMISISKPSR